MAWIATSKRYGPPKETVALRRVISYKTGSRGTDFELPSAIAGGLVGPQCGSATAPDATVQVFLHLMREHTFRCRCLQQNAKLQAKLQAVIIEQQVVLSGRAGREP